MTDPVDQLNADTQAVVAQLRGGAVIQNDDQYVSAGQLYRQAKDREKTIKDHFAPLKKITHDAHKKIVAAENDALAVLTGPIMQIKCAMERYDAEKRRKAAEEARRLEVLRQEELARQAEALRAAQPDISPLEEAMALEEIEEALPVPVSLPVAAAAPKISGVVYRTVLDREKVLAALPCCDQYREIPGLIVDWEPKITVLALADVPEQYKRRQ